MNQKHNQSRIIFVAVAIVTLIFINIGIFYTSEIIKQTEIPTNSASQAIGLIKLNNNALNILRQRQIVNVDNQLNPYQSGRPEPFSSGN